MRNSVSVRKSRVSQYLPQHGFQYYNGKHASDLDIVLANLRVALVDTMVDTMVEAPVSSH